MKQLVSVLALLVGVAVVSMVLAAWCSAPSTAMVIFHT